MMEGNLLIRWLQAAILAITSYAGKEKLKGQILYCASPTHQWAKRPAKPSTLRQGLVQGGVWINCVSEWWAISRTGKERRDGL